MSLTRTYELSITTQGPPYPPSEIMDAGGDFVVIGMINREGAGGAVERSWGAAIVSPKSELPPFGEQVPYAIVRELDDALPEADREMVLYTLPLPLPCTNYPMVFAPEQRPDAGTLVRPSYPLHQAPIPDLRPEDGPKVTEPVTLGQWVRARGELRVTLAPDRRSADFAMEFAGMIPNSLYTVMSLRAHDLDPAGPTRPGPLGVPNVFVADADGRARYHATMPNPFPDPGREGANRIVNVVVLWMSYQQNYGGAIGWFGLGGDIHAQLKLQQPAFHEFVTTD
ncbi:hypothetical protein ACTWP5_06155 [Streptomyces sp. 4N509B]|uniref:hypothetical protein n=1 Tax=Streptomyces sp. 4N509B TaxID=3457413 RepID=UPI003FD036DB